MEIKYEEWDRVVKQVETTVKSDAISSQINNHVLEFVTQERDKCPMETSKNSSPKPAKHG